MLFVKSGAQPEAKQMSAWIPPLQCMFTGRGHGRLPLCSQQYRHGNLRVPDFVHDIFAAHVRDFESLHS